MNDMYKQWRRALISPDTTLAETIENINKVAIKLSLCVDAKDRLVGTVSDGDVRRGLLSGLSLQDPVRKIVNTDPLVVSVSTSREAVRSMMKDHEVQQVPIIDAEGVVVGLHQWDTLNSEPSHEHTMVIMAGGKGKRLRPYTENCPKPMLTVSDKPILYHIIQRAKSQGFRHFVLSLNYLGDTIRDYFGDGSAIGVKIIYVEEDQPLGTAGALSLINPRPENAFVVTNGDVLTDINYYDLLNFREQHNADSVMAVRTYEWTNPYGVVQMEGVNIVGFIEKPVSKSPINAGVYVFTPAVLDQLKYNQYCDMPDFFDQLRAAKHSTVAYLMREEWIDVGYPDDLKRANVTYKAHADELEKNK